MTTLSTGFTAAVGIDHPIVHAPMAGGATTPDLVAAVNNAGALGSFAAAILAPPALGDIEQSCIGLMALIPQVVAAIKRPVIATGGIMNGRGIATSLILGAQATQHGAQRI